MLIDTTLSVRTDKAHSVFIIDRLASIEALLSGIVPLHLLPGKHW